jgi:hypothetical protein
VYIGDDASSEDPSTLLTVYEDKFDFIYKKFHSNIGNTSLVKQWERCIDLIKNETWIQILGDDDVLDVNCVASFYKRLNEIEKNSCSVVRYASRYIDDTGKPLENYPDYVHPKIELATDSFYRNYFGTSRSSLSEHIFKLESYKKFQFYDFPLAWHSDDRAWLEFSNFNNIYTINNVLVSIRVTDQSITGNKNNQLLKNKARYLFLKDVVYHKLSYFKNYQKKELLLEFGILMKNQSKITIKNTSYIVLQFIKIGDFISLIKFLRRMFIAKFKNKN